MADIDIPADPAPNGYVPNPYEEELKHAYEYVKRETDSADGWSSIGTKGGVVMEKKRIQGDSSSVPLVRGMSTIKNVQPLDFLPMVTNLGAREYWDTGFQEGHLLERYSRRAYRLYTVQKGAFLVQPRDFVVVHKTFFEDEGIVYCVLCSVPSDEKTPPVIGKTRGTITAAGWRLRPNGVDTDISYIVKVNPKGSLPSYIVNLVVQEIPYGVVNIIDWVHSDGLIPYIREPKDPKSSFRFENYAHSERRRYQLSMICSGGEGVEVSIDNKIKYKNGYTVTIENEAKEHVSFIKETDALKVRFAPEAEGKKVDIIVKAELSIA